MGNVRIHAPGGGDKPFVAGTYIGDGAASRNIILGFQPSVVIIWRYDGLQKRNDGHSYGGMAMPGKPCIGVMGNSTYTSVSVLSDGFQVYEKDPQNVHTNYTGIEYHYIAFR